MRGSSESAPAGAGSALSAGQGGTNTRSPSPSGQGEDAVERKIKRAYRDWQGKPLNLGAEPEVHEIIEAAFAGGWRARDKLVLRLIQDADEEVQRAEVAEAALSRRPAAVAEGDAELCENEDEPRLPRTPTDAMMQAGLYHSSHDSTWAEVFTMWQAMFDAHFLDGGMTDSALPALSGVVAEGDAVRLSADESTILHRALVSSTKPAALSGAVADSGDVETPETRHERDCAYVVNDGPAPCTCRAGLHQLRPPVASEELRRPINPAAILEADQSPIGDGPQITGIRRASEERRSGGEEG